MSNLVKGLLFHCKEDIDGGFRRTFGFRQFLRVFPAAVSMGMISNLISLPTVSDFESYFEISESTNIQVSGSHSFRVAGYVAVQKIKRAE